MTQILLAQHISNVWLSLGKPTQELCEQDQIHFAVRQALMLRTGQIFQSDNDQSLETSASFTPTSSPHSLAAVITTKFVPAILEQQVGNTWVPMRIVPLARLEYYRRNGTAAAAFHGDRAGIEYVSFSYPVSVASTTVYRIRYDLAEYDFTLADASGSRFPNFLATLIELDAVIQLIPDIAYKIADQIENEEARKLIAPKLAALDKKLAHAEMTRERDWLPLFRNWKNKSKSSQTSGRLPNKTSRGLYGS
jgi:hypothetical protein